ncbi:MAG: riboflavin biosynthesis protein RibD, partial [Candidatus Omnitrophica bacterium]|nr:riboflavin biosynthesis protein RibD [Candidatus Omnitrophota bacterium]
MNMSKNLKYMRKAVILAEKGRGKTHPNPLVGCVIVKNNKIIAQGYHEKFGSAHAEVNALNKAGNGAKGASLYVSLE